MISNPASKKRNLDGLKADADKIFFKQCSERKQFEYVFDEPFPMPQWKEYSQILQERIENNK